MHGSLTALALMAFLVAGPTAGSVSAQPAPEAVKAAFVFNVLNFVEWPTQGTSTAPLRVAVIAPQPLSAFAAALKGKAVRGRTIAVQTYDNIDAVEQAEVVFVSAEASAQLKSLLKKVEGRPVLSISEQSLSAPVDSTVALGIVDARLAFAVNLDVADASGLQFSPNLLKLAKSVKSARAKTR